MKVYRSFRLAAVATMAVAVTLQLGSLESQAHCDGVDGPVVQAAERALSETNVNHALIWVRNTDEPEIRHVFEKTVAVRQLGPEAKELADRFFFETLVRVHRAAEGAPYTGLKAAGRDLGPAIPAGDRALKTGDLKPVLSLLTRETEHRLTGHFHEAVERSKFDRNDVQAGREFVSAYVKYIHYVEGVHQAAKGQADAHAGEPGPASRHEH